MFDNRLAFLHHPPQKIIHPLSFHTIYANMMSVNNFHHLWPHFMIQTNHLRKQVLIDFFILNDFHVYHLMITLYKICNFTSNSPIQKHNKKPVIGPTISADNRIRTCTSRLTDTWNQRVYQFHHIRIAIVIIHKLTLNCTNLFWTLSQWKSLIKSRI